MADADDPILLTVAAPERPPFPGEWKPREELPDGLNTAKSLGDICYYSPEMRRWETGITSESGVRYFVRIAPADVRDCGPDPVRY